jgi:hypothetical protein
MEEGVKMRKTWALVVVMLGAAVAVAGPGSKQASRSHDTYGSDYEPSSSSATVAPSTDAATPEPLPEPAKVGTALIPIEGVPPAAPPAGPAAGCGCGSGSHGSCVQRFCDWLTYQPLQRGCDQPCSACGCKGCCGYHCFPPLYLFFLHPCADNGTPPPTYPPSCGCGHGCAGGHAWFGGVRRLLHHGEGCDSSTQ